jgi:hypothetical protein
MKILLVGTHNAKILVQQLQYYGINASVFPPSKIPNPFLLRKYSVIYGIHLMSLTRTTPFIKLLSKKSLIHIIGSDAFRHAKTKESIKKMLWKLTLNTCSEILYVTEELKQIMKTEKGKIIPIPIDTRMFKEQKYLGEKRDILYYCPGPETYRLEWILDYAKKHPKETVSILGYPRQIRRPNIKVIHSMPYHKMPELYYMHRRLIRMTTHDGYPKMPYEALLCGLAVSWNNQRITKIPAEMLMEKTVPKLISIIENL